LEGDFNLDNTSLITTYLRLIDELKEAGILDEYEYKKRRKEILEKFSATSSASTGYYIESDETVDSGWKRDIDLSKNRTKNI
jgi:hypothetical protein